MIQVIKTADGSYSIFNEMMNEHYHSTNGALAESNHVYIENGLRYKLKENPEELKILEIGFGTGLNAILSYVESQKHQTRIEYTALEPYPLPPEILLQLNFSEFLSDNDFRIWMSMHTQNLHKDNFQLQVLKQTLQDFKPHHPFDLIYFDAFAPSKQPEMWSAEMIGKCSSALAAQGILVSYCSKGEFKRNLQNSGLKIEKLAGPLGKREIIRASAL
jgi:tRNA U34 5-methylaminomethyl-2-thiouridine-forming methyltransferase MnmC